MKTIKDAVNYFVTWPMGAVLVGWDLEHEYWSLVNPDHKNVGISPVFNEADFNSAVKTGTRQKYLEISKPGPSADATKEARAVTSATDYLQACIDVQAQRGKEYQGDDNERSFKTVSEMFNTVTGRDLKASDICLMLTILKLVRQYSNPERLHHDSLLDGVSYMSLWAEELTKELGNG